MNAVPGNAPPGNAVPGADPARAVVEAVLYEGYALYPYRASSVKNRHRWTFGGLFPEGSAAVADGSERCTLHAECLVEGAAGALIEAELGFLQALDRQPVQCLGGDEFEPVAFLDVDDRRYVNWQEAIERSVSLGPYALEQLAGEAGRQSFGFGAVDERELLRNREGHIAGALVRTAMPVAGEIRVKSELLQTGLYRISAEVRNTTVAPTGAPDAARTGAATLLSAHLVLKVHHAAFVSAIDPPAQYVAAAAACRNVGCFPVLLGEAPARGAVLCSPIILYDYPQIAPESAGGMFDATEIDEILTLRVLTMTDAEKREMAALDERVARILVQAQSLDQDTLARLHGTWRMLRPAAQPLPVSAVTPGAPAAVSDAAAERPLQVRDRVRIRPKRSADIMDTALAGRTAVVESIERDLEDAIYIAVTLDDDPGRDLGAARMPGHRFFFSADELEPLVGQGSA